MSAKKPVSPRKQPSQGRSRFTVQQIVEAAARVLKERGYAGATTNRIAERAGVSIGSLMVISLPAVDERPAVVATRGRFMKLFDSS